MLSRANSSAGTRLRRAKSSSSVHHKVHDIHTPAVDPRHAEMAAVEAYRRARKHDDSSSRTQSSSNPQKRQNKTSRRSEGSHFEDSRSGKRMGVSRPKGPSRSGSVKHSEVSLEPLSHTAALDHEETVITRPRRVVDTAPEPAIGLTRQDSLRHSTAASRSVRKAKSAYYEQPYMDEDTVHSTRTRYSMPYPDTPYRTAIERVQRCSDPGDPVTLPNPDARKPTPREMQTDETIKVAAWDAYLQDFHQRKVRVRKSFIAPIKKRLVKEVLPIDQVHYDASVPPFNFASESDDVFSPPLPEVEAANDLQVDRTRKTRTVSDSLKVKFKRLMGISKRVQSTLPAQHVEAQHLHFDPHPKCETTEATSNGYSLSLPTQAFSSPSTTQTRKSSSRSGHSDGDAATMKSRVTSWTNSTGGGTIRTSGQGAPLCSIDESGMLDQPGPESRHGSFLGRALRLPLRRNSRADLNRSSEDSQRLYDALQKQIQGPEENTIAGMETTINSQTVATECVLKEYLEPPYRGDIENKSAVEEQLTKVPPEATIRPVAPEVLHRDSFSSGPMEAPNRPPPKPPIRVTREASWMRSARRSLPSQTQKIKNEVSDASVSHKEQPDTVIPSQEQRASRLGRSQNRWQAALEDQSTYSPRAMDYHPDDDPYRLRSVSATPQDEYLPVAVRHTTCENALPSLQAPRSVIPNENARNQVISPSVYSRTSGHRSITPDGGLLKGQGTYITVTGREVKRYSLDSPAKSVRDECYIVKPSLEWKNWLNTELGGFGTNSASEELTLHGQDAYSDLNRTPDVLPATSGHLRQSAERLNSDDTIPYTDTDMSHGPMIRAPKTRRPVLGKRRSSIMNDRYPLIETGRESEAKARAGPVVFNKQSSSNLKNTRVTRAPSTEPSVMDKAVATTSLRPRVRERHSAAVLSTSYQRSKQTSPEEVVVAEEDHCSKRSKHKSALDLRAVYRSAHKTGNGTINVRRKPISVVLQEDHTLRKISEGPYAQPSPTNKENTAPSRSPSLIAVSKLTSEEDGSGASGQTYLTGSRGGHAWTSNSRPESGAFGGRGRESPGQRLADEFLSSRKGVAGPSSAADVEGSSPAFI